MIVDPATHRIVDANPVALRMIGADRDQVVGHVCHAHVCPAEKGQCPITDLKKVVDNAERKLLRLDGTVVHVLKTVVEVDIDGRPMLLESFVDISDRLRVQQELQRAKEAAEAANRAKSDFLANMSHELRTPLTAIIGFADLIQEKALGNLTAKQEQYIGIIAESGRHLLSLINEILDLAKVESGTMVLECAPVSITNLLEHSMTLFKEKCLKHGIRQSLDVRDEAQGVMVKLDERRIRQVLFNLLSNAVKFTPDGGQIRIEVCIIPDSGPDDAPGPGRAWRPACRLFRFPFWIRESAFRRSSARRFSRRSIRSTAARRTRRRAPGSGWRSCERWWNCMAAAYGWKARARAKAAPFGSPFPSSRNRSQHPSFRALLPLFFY